MSPVNHTSPEPYRPSPGRVADWVEGRLTPEDAARVAAAIEGDPGLTELADWVREFAATAAVVPLESPPPLLQQRLRQYFDRWASARAVLERPVPTIRVELVFDSRVDRPLELVRGEAETQAFHLAFRADPVDIVLDLRPRSDGLLDLSGQVLTAETTGAPVFEASASVGDSLLRSVDGDDLGRFELVSVPPELLELRVGNGELEIVAAMDLRPVEP